jgi:hypothetical protein
MFGGSTVSRTSGVWVGAGAIIALPLIYFLWDYVPLPPQQTVDDIGRRTPAPVIIRSDEDCSFLADVIRTQHPTGLSERVPVLDDVGTGFIRCTWTKYGLDLKNASRASLQDGPPSPFGQNLKPHIELDKPQYSLLHNRAAVLIYRGSVVDFCVFGRTFSHWRFDRCRQVAVI